DSSVLAAKVSCHAASTAAPAGRVPFGWSRSRSNQPIRYGLERLPDGRRKDSLLAAATEVFAAFSEFIQPFDADAAVWYATIGAQRDRLGLPIDGFNGQIAAICRTRGAALATHNAKDFGETGIDVIDPWQQSQPADHTAP